VKTFNQFHQVIEKDEHKKSAQYKKLSPKMKSAVDEVFTVLESNPQDFLSTFDKTVSKVAKKHGVKEKDILKYFDKEMLTL
jgi:hypothetical protein|tara:strand:- start:307 stop:549 length:243 start_codon:yes stop_codon:yes gene_type:complete